MTSKTIFTIILSFTLGVSYIGKAMEIENTKASNIPTEDAIALKIEAEKGDAEAQYRLANAYSTGWGGLPKDPLIADFWFEKSAAQNHPQAQIVLGGTYLMYLNCPGAIPKNEEKALYWVQKAADQGFPPAQYHIADVYQKGVQGFHQDYQKAFEWFEKAARQGYSFAQTNLGRMYGIGLGIPQDYQKAFFWNLCAANQGNDLAQCNVGLMCQRGLGTSQDYQQALFWLQKGADQNNALSQTALAEMYLNGWGASVNYQQALFWYQKGADQGNPIAQNGLAAMYFNGFGTPIDNDKGSYWYQKSAENGEPKPSPAVESINIPPRNRLHATFHSLSLHEKALSGLKKAHHENKNNHKNHYKVLLQSEKEGDVKAKKHLDSIRHSHPQKQPGRETKRLLKEVEEEVTNPTKTASVAEAPLVVNAPTAPPSSKDKDKGSHFMKRGKKIFKQAKRVSTQNQSDDLSETEAEPVIETPPMFTTPPTLAAREPIHLIPFSPIEPPVERFIPPESKGEKIKKKGKEHKSKWRLFDKKKKDKNPAKQNGESSENKESTQLAMYPSGPLDQNQSLPLWKTIKKILRTPIQTIALNENIIVKTLYGLHEAGKINLRNVIPTEAGMFMVMDQKIVATKVNDHLASLTIHTHGKWWKRPGIIKDFIYFLQALPEKNKREFQDALYNIKKDKK